MAPVKHPLMHYSDAGSQAQHLQRLDQLASLFESIRSAPLPVVDDLVRDIRTTHGGLKKDLTPVGPWEGLEGEPRLCEDHILAEANLMSL